MTFIGTNRSSSAIAAEPTEDRAADKKFDVRASSACTRSARAPIIFEACSARRMASLKRSWPRPCPCSDLSTPKHCEDDNGYRIGAIAPECTRRFASRNAAGGEGVERNDLPRAAAHYVNSRSVSFNSVARSGSEPPGYGFAPAIEGAEIVPDGDQQEQRAWRAARRPSTLARSGPIRVCGRAGPSVSN